MGIEFFKPLGVSGINSNIAINPNRHNVRFGQSQPADTFENTSITRFTNEIAIKTMATSNPKISNILSNAGIPFNINMKELQAVLENHSKDTQNIVVGLTENLPFSLQNQVDVKCLEDAAYLHDIGKVFIPVEILNKNGKLNTKETEIMHKHSELGYELLKNTDINKKTLHLIKNHHQNAKGNGYPFVSKDFKADLNLQILTCADKYSALCEKRSYKEPLSREQALTIIYRDVVDEKLHPFVFKALVSYTKSNDAENIAANALSHNNV